MVFCYLLKEFSRLNSSLVEELFISFSLLFLRTGSFQLQVQAIYLLPFLFVFLCFFYGIVVLANMLVLRWRVGRIKTFVLFSFSFPLFIRMLIVGLSYKGLFIIKLRYILSISYFSWQWALSWMDVKIQLFFSV